MPVIKRYSNRKLYDTDSKRYVTLEDLAEFIRRGEDVRVVDHVSGDDLTSMTLLQVVFEEEKKISGLLPSVLLARLIRAGGDTVSTLRSRLAAIDPFQMVDEEIRRRVRGLVEQERITEEESARWLDLLLTHRAAPGEAVTIPVQAEEPAEVPAAVAEPPVDTQEINALQKQVEQLEQELARLKTG